MNRYGEVQELGAGGGVPGLPQIDMGFTKRERHVCRRRMRNREAAGRFF